MYFYFNHYIIHGNHYNINFKYVIELFLCGVIDL